MPLAATVPAVSLIIGVLIGSHIPDGHPAFLEPGLGLLLFAATVAFLTRRSRIFLLSASAGYVLSGVGLSARAHDLALRSSLVQSLETSGFLAPSAGAPAGHVEPVVIEGTLREDASASPSGVRLSLNVDHMSTNHKTSGVSGGVLLSVSGQQARSHVDEWRAGRRIRSPATLRRPARFLNPGVPDAERALAFRHTALVGSIKSAGLVELVARGSYIAESAGAARAYVRRAMDANVACWSEMSSAIVTAILIGDRAGLDDEVERQLQIAGTYHVLAISGGNIAILSGLLILVLRLSGLRPWANLVIAGVLVAYAGIASAESSVVRATIMATAYFVARLGDLRVSAADTLMVAAVLIVAVAPLAVHDIGFILSFGATLGLLVAATTWPALRSQPWWRRICLQLFVASLSAEAVLLPVAARAFSRVTFAGLVLNFAAIPLMTVAQLSGLGVVLIAPLSGSLARTSGFIAHQAARGLVSSAGLVTWLPELVVRTPPPSIVTMLWYYGALIGWLAARHMRRQRGTAARSLRRIQHAAGIGLVSALLWILLAPSLDGRAATLLVKVLDVGQGDSAMVRLPDGRTVLVDTGGSPMPGAFDIGARVVAPALWAAGVRRLDYLAITHGDPDHMGGAISVVRDFRPTEIWQGVPVPRHQPTRALKAETLSVHAGWRTLVAGDALESGRAAINVWHPPVPDWERVKVRNDDSLVFDIRLGDLSFVFTGDIGSAVEHDLLPRIVPAKIRILKVPHHGSLTSSSEDFLRALRPDVAIFTVGRHNRFGHPHPTVLARYRRLGIQIFRTDEDGMVTVESDGQSVDIRTFTGKRLVIATSNEQRATIRK